MKHVKKRGKRYHYVRRVPGSLRDLDAREFIQISLNTDSQTLAKQRATLLDQHVQTYWSMFVNATPNPRLFAADF